MLYNSWRSARLDPRLNEFRGSGVESIEFILGGRAIQTEASVHMREKRKDRDLLWTKQAFKGIEGHVELIRAVSASNIHHWEEAGLLEIVP